MRMMNNKFGLTDLLFLLTDLPFRHMTVMNTPVCGNAASVFMFLLFFQLFKVFTFVFVSMALVGKN